MLGPCTGLGQHLHDVAQRLLGLGGKIVALEHLLGIPADLARDKDLLALGGDAVGKALGRCPMLGVEKLHVIARDAGVVAWT